MQLLAKNSVIGLDGSTEGIYPFGEIEDIIKEYDLVEYFDNTAKAAYFYSPTKGYFFTGDNEESVKTEKIYDKNNQSFESGPKTIKTLPKSLADLLKDKIKKKKLSSKNNISNINEKITIIQKDNDISNANEKISIISKKYSCLQ